MKHWLWWLVAIVIAGWAWVAIVWFGPAEQPPLQHATAPPAVEIPPPPPLPPAVQSQPLPPPPVVDTEPGPTPIPEGEKRPTAQGDPRPPNTMWEFYPSLDALLKDAQSQNFSFAITVDGKQVHSGFGPPDEFVTNPNGTLLSKNYHGGKRK